MARFTHYLMLLCAWSLNMCNIEAQTPRPTIQFQPEWTKYYVGEGLTIRCVGENPSTITGYSFYKNGMTNGNQSVNVLTFPTLSKDDSGKYFCIYYRENGTKSSESNPANLEVLDPLPVASLIIDPPKNVFLINESVALTCITPPAAGIGIYRNGIVNLRANNFGVLNITKLQITDSGNYSCGYRINQTGRSIESKLTAEETIIVIEQPSTPRLRYPFTNHNEGEPIELTCELQNPISWFHGYHFYQDGKKIASVNMVNHITVSNFTKACYFCRTFVTILGQVFESPKSPEHFLPINEGDGTQCLEKNTYAHVLSQQGLKFYGSILAGKFLVVIAMLALFGIQLLILLKRNQKYEMENQ